MIDVRIIPNFSGTGCIIYDTDGWANLSPRLLIKVLPSGLHGVNVSGIIGVDEP